VLLQRYGPAFTERLGTLFAEAGLPYANELEKVPNSRRSLLLGELARDRGVYGDLHPRLFEAYWARGRDLGDDQVLAQEGATIGLEAQEIEAALDSPEYLARVQEQTNVALELGASGVPAWLVDERVLVPGAQPHELFERVMERLGHEPVES
jgi:predicted DsbA family dithiol-disulfide isomerase